ncbi:two-component system, OmpR family, sensor histidine kinase KdpD [Candidatus Gastranaerophilus sp. (ex Termes propinquus)]|nr:two-component system, OmpR family, sensor histidine kinase KdpD [Candidatus Gastranaerophilus sp. (ex Termes propinquus)]
MKNLKIVQQIIIVLLFALLIPFITIGVIIANVSQQSMRKELTYSAKMISQFTGENIRDYLENAQERLDETTAAIPFFYYAQDTKDYLQQVENNYGLFSDLKIVDKNSVIDGFVFDPGTYTIKLSSKIDSNDKDSAWALSAQISVANLEKILTKHFSDGDRGVFIFDIDNSLIASSVKNKDMSSLAKILESLPQEKILEQPEVFGTIKNQPSAYYKLKNPNWTVVVLTNKQLTESTIDLARFRIVLALFTAALFIIFVVGLYTSYLYVNIRQLFKGIIAVSKGSYERKIHLIKSIFTPGEILFLAQEFNSMAQKISESHKAMQDKNAELARLDEFRTNLVNATSHEFRTPLTSIIGYASRLLRQDIKIDEKTRTSSLKIIKQQAQMLSRMVEDLLVVPEIESFRLQLNLENSDLTKIVEESVLYTTAADHRFSVNIDPDLPLVCTDKNRLVQIFINLFENALKYSIPDTPISILGGLVEGRVAIMVSNKSKPIPEEILPKLFEKFTRLDSGLTNTARGTGLGLFIVKGLANAMGIETNLNYDDDMSEFQVTLVFQKGTDCAAE